MFLKKAVALFLLIMLAGQTGIAEDKKEVFQHVTVGEPVPFEGFLFTPEALVKIYISTEEENKKLKLECDNKLILKDIDMQKLMDLSASETRINAKLLADTVQSKDEIIENKEQLLKKLDRRIAIDKLLMLGSFIAGTALTFTIVYYTTNYIK